MTNNPSDFKLSPETQIIIENLCPGLSMEEAIEFLANMAEVESPPPTIDEFLEKKKYLGHITIYPFWRKQLRIIHPSPYFSPYKSVILSGAIGGGKTTCCLVSMLYELCVFLHRKNPHTHFGFTEGQPLA